ncbi:MAG: hypothetical protein IPG06_18455 [Haliea sp.]|nr:hypothetical protein [Haliea sp.]
MSKAKVAKAKVAKTKAKVAKPAARKSKAGGAKVASKAPKKTPIKGKALARLIEDIIEEGANSAEDIHRAVLDLPATMLENLGLKSTSKNMKKVQDSSIGAVYKLIHEINHEVANLATRLLDKREKAVGGSAAKKKRAN